MFQKIKQDLEAVVDLGIVLMIVMVFAALLVIGYIMYQLTVSLNPTGAAASTMKNISTGYDNAVKLILVAITIFILALAISALLILRGRGD